MPPLPSGHRLGLCLWIPAALPEIIEPQPTLLQLVKLDSNSLTTMTDSSSRFGFVAFAETWNGRMAMLGFVIGLATELLTGQSILQQIGLG
jgi:hypothetical protein